MMVAKEIALYASDVLRAIGIMPRWTREDP
jgi:hypothetical protein